MKVVGLVGLPLEIYEVFKRDFSEAEYCPNTETMSMPVKHFSALMTHPLLLEMVEDRDLIVEIIVCEED